MEVHAHTHTARKKWTHYFWEFFMLFLAITLGFFVENEREHLIEHKREKILIKEMLEDLRKDTAYLHLCVSYFVPNHIRMMDSAINLLKQKGNEKDRETYQAYLTATEWNYNYVPTERTLSQMRSYGYRLVRNSQVADILSELEINYKVYMNTNDHVHTLQNDIDESAVVFADRQLVSELAIKEYQFPNDVSIDPASIPSSASVNKADKDLPRFIAKLKKYNYYIATSLNGEYQRILKFQQLTMSLLQKEYNLK